MAVVVVIRILFGRMVVVNKRDERTLFNRTRNFKRLVDRAFIPPDRVICFSFSAFIIIIIVNTLRDVFLFLISSKISFLVKRAY